MQGHFLTSGLRRLNKHYQSGGEKKSNATLKDILYTYPLGDYAGGRTLSEIADKIVWRLLNGYVYLDSVYEDSYYRSSGGGFTRYGNPISTGNTYEFINQGTSKRSQVIFANITTNTATTLTITIQWRLLNYLGDWDGDTYNDTFSVEITITDRFTANPTWSKASDYLRVDYTDASGYGIHTGVTNHIILSPNLVRIKVGYPL